MRVLLEVMGYIMLCSVIFGLVFIFQGTPDLWDKWHERVMADAECMK